ncbi:MAG: gliding motility-associated C-terminal domain-containing protein [Bacteroidota bacterium]
MKLVYQGLWPLCVFLVVLGIHADCSAQVFYTNTFSGLEEITIENGNCNRQLIGPFVEAGTGVGIGTGDLGLCENGLIYVMNNNTLFEVDPTTAVGIPIADAPEPLLIVGIGCDGNSNVFLAGFSFDGFVPVLYSVNVNTGVFTLLGTLPFTPSGDIVLANGVWYLTANEGLVELDINNLDNSVLINTVGTQVGVTVFPEDCNVLLVGQESTLSLLNIETGELTPLCTLPTQFIGGLTTIEEFSSLPTDCNIVVDLDEDDSSGAAGADFNAPSGDCLAADDIPIADSDVVVSSSSDIDQMTISISGVLPDAGFESLILGLQPNIQVVGSGTPFLILTNLGAASSLDFQVALSQVRYQNTADLPSAGIREITVSFGTVDFETSNISTAFIDIIDLGQVGVDLGPDQDLCPGQTLILDAGNPGGTFLWSTTESTPTISINAIGTYSVTVSDGIRCPGSDEIEIVLSDGDTVNIEETSCDPDQIGVFTDLLTNQFGCDSTVITTVAFGDADTTTLNLSSCDPSEVGDFEEILTNQQGCDSVVFTTVSLLPTDATAISTTTCSPDEVGVFTEVLTNQFGCDSTVVTTVTLLESSMETMFETTCIPSQAGTFSEVFINQFGCDSTIITRVELAPSEDCLDIRAEIFAPTAFSPNDDGVNDRFTLFGEAGEFAIEELRIFTRWGESVFVAFDLPPNDLSRGWDGTFRDSPLSSGVYIYRAQVRYESGTTGLLKGDVTLIR